MQLEAILFDLDGTLGDTLPVCYAAFRAAFAEFTGVVYSDAEILAMFGPDEAGVIRQRVPERWQACLERFYQVYDEVHVGYGAFPGLPAALMRLRQRGVRLGVVTGKGARSAAVSLRHFGLQDMFDAVEPGSPNGGIKPEAIARILHRWGIAPARAAYLGDLVYDIQAARAAGVLPLAAAWASTADEARLRAQAPAAVFRTVDEFVAWIDEHESGRIGQD
mgnify:FL=1